MSPPGSSWPIWLAAVCLAIVGYMVKTIVAALQYPLKIVPAPAYAAFTNFPLKAAVVSGRRMHHVHALHQQYGPIVRISPTEVSVADLQAFKQIHSIGSGFEKSPWYSKMTNQDRYGVFDMTDNKMHAARRKLLSRPFSKTHLRQHWEDIVRERVELAVSRIREAGSRGAAVDVLQWWTFMASDVSTHLMFGQSFQTLEQGKMSEYVRMLTSTMMGGGIGLELPLVRLIGSWLPFEVCRDMFCANERLREYAKLAVVNMKSTQGSSNIFANMMAEAEKGERLDDRDVEVEAQNLIVAGTDTTSITLTYLVWAVLSRPDLQRRIEEEVRELPQGFRDADVEKLEVLGAATEETLRLYGAAPGGLPRIVPPHGAELGGYFIPGGTTVTTQAYTMHRDATLFPDPLEFRVERWLASEKDSMYRADTTKVGYSPFGTGSRTCLGVHVAYMELRLAAAEFFRKCAGARLAPSTTPESMEMQNFFLIAPVAHQCEIIVS